MFALPSALTISCVNHDRVAGDKNDLMPIVIIKMVFKLFIYSLSNYNPRNKLAYGIPLQVKII